MSESVKDEAAKIKLRYLERVIGQAFYEGAKPANISMYLTQQGIQNPDAWITKVTQKKITPLLGAIELKNLGGRDEFRALFHITTPIEESVKPENPYTELGDAEHFAKHYADDLRYDYRRGRWLISDETTGLWIPDSVERVIGYAARSVRSRQKLAVKINDRNERTEALKWTLAGESRSRLNNVLALSQALDPIANDGDGWDGDPFLLGCPNGVVDLRTGILRRALPAEHVSQRTMVPYDPTATCPLWLATLDGIFASTDIIESQLMVAFAQRAFGYSATGDCREECCFFAWGEGSNGKGTLMNAIGEILHDYTDDMPYSTLEKSIHGSGIPTDVAKLAGKRFITCSEANEFKLNESRLKALTGRDPMTARFLNQDFFTFRPIGKIWIATNNKPRIIGLDDGIWRRIFLIPFNNQFLGRQKNDQLKDQLRLERAGILNWLVQGVMMWLKEGLNPPATVLAATASYREESDPLTPFVEARCTLDQTSTCRAGAAWNEYQEFCRDNRLDEGVRLSDKMFHKLMRKRFGHNVNRAGQASYSGIGILVREKGAEPQF